MYERHHYTIGLKFTTLPSVSPISPVPKMFVWMCQSLHTGVHVLLSSFFIDHNLCVESGVRLFQAPFCEYTTVINENPVVLWKLHFTKFIQTRSKHEFASTVNQNMSRSVTLLMVTVN